MLITLGMIGSNSVFGNLSNGDVFQIPDLAQGEFVVISVDQESGVITTNALPLKMSTALIQQYINDNSITETYQYLNMITPGENTTIISQPNANLWIQSSSNQSGVPWVPKGAAWVQCSIVDL